MKISNRRRFLRTTTLASVAAGLTGSLSLGQAAESEKRKMTMDLNCGSINVRASQTEAIELATRFGFESVGADAGYLATLSASQAAELKATLKEKHLVFGAASLAVEFRQDQAKFEETMKALPATARALQQVGVDRIATWLMPCDGQLTYLENFRQHAKRLREIAKTLNDYNLRLGLEYVGPKTLWASRRYPFVHTMNEMKELIAEIGADNVGFLLDSWHWWHAGDTTEDILSLKARQVIAVDLNDAPAGIPKDQQVDGRRELACATGVIEVAPFLNTLNRIGYDGPVRSEPFNQAVNKMSKEDACAASAAALRKAFALIH
jgi:sugar phosphate isomerase/epimerase